MGLFSNLRKSASPSTQEATAKAVISLPLIVAAADGKLEESELHQIMNMCAFSPIFHEVGAETTQRLAKECLDEIVSDGGAGRLFAQAHNVLTPQLVETTMCFAIRTALADGHLDENEKTVLIGMGEKLGLSEGTFMKIFDVVVMMQRSAA